MEDRVKSRSVKGRDRREESKKEKGGTSSKPISSNIRGNTGNHSCKEGNGVACPYPSLKHVKSKVATDGERMSQRRKPEKRAAPQRMFLLGAAVPKKKSQGFESGGTQNHWPGTGKQIPA